MTRKRPQPRRDVKRHLTYEHLHELHARLLAAELIPDLLAAPWYFALDSDLDLPHPVHDRVRDMLAANSPLQKQRRAAHALRLDFQKELPRPLLKLWLEIDRLRTEESVIETIAAYDLGVHDGKESVVVEASLTAEGIDTGAIELRTLFLLSHVLATIARCLPLTMKKAA